MNSLVSTIDSRGQIRLMLNNYKRLALINTGQHELERYRDYARRTAMRFGLKYEEIEGSTIYKKLLLARRAVITIHSDRRGLACPFLR